MNLRFNPENAPLCQICGTPQLCEVANFTSLHRITSDCRNFSKGGHLFVCRGCGGVQKKPDKKWLDEIREIYSHYEVYYQSGGDEQIVFDRISGSPRRRSDVITAHLLAGNHFVHTGHVLDVGCGNGATLRAMSSALEKWNFSGYELGDCDIKQLSGINGFSSLYTGELDAIRKTFDLITMIHALEHFPSPLEYLMKLHALVGKGKLFIEVCNVE
ncbi:MAG: methyltransferase domain-containing protein, partial [Mariprofundales bacterium]